MPHVLSLLYSSRGVFPIAFKEALPSVGTDAHRYDCLLRGSVTRMRTRSRKFVLQYNFPFQQVI